MKLKKQNFSTISRLIFIIFCYLILVSYLYDTAHAQEQKTWEVEIDEVPIWITVIKSESNSNENNFKNYQDWWEYGNTNTDTYIFAVNQSDNVSLILNFNQDNNHLQAKLYFVEESYGLINKQQVSSIFQVLDNDILPYITIEALDGQWINDKGPNYNLVVYIDGPYNQGEYGDPNNKTDGTIDFIINVQASDKGDPLWQTINVVNDNYTPEQRGWSRFVGWLRMPDSPEFRLREPIMPSFPLLGLGFHESNWFEENPSPIFFHIGLNNIYLRPFVTFHIGGSYHINSINPPPNVNFEAPFAFYNFDQKTRQSQLVIRGGYSSVEAPLDYTLPSPRLGVRYSWKTDDDQRWQYGLQLSDFYEYVDEITLGDSKIITVEPEKLPKWVISKSWRAVTFIESMEGYPSSEGIYFYAADYEDWLWLAGMTDNGGEYLKAPLLQESTQLTNLSSRTMPAGFRGEFMFANNKPPKLYLSHIDNMLHLVGAQGGIWYLGNGILVRSKDLDQDGVIDYWAREEVPPELDKNGLRRANPGNVIETIFDVNEYLLYSSAESVEIVQSNFEQVAFTITPPSDKETWEEFRIRLRPYETQRRNPTDLKSWFDAFNGPRNTITGAHIANLHITSYGFRFDLLLKPGYYADGTDLLDLTGLEPGRYMVVYDESVFKIYPSTLPSLSLDIKSQRDDSRGFEGFYHINLIANNQGLQDSPVVEVVLIADCEHESLDLLRQFDSIPGDDYLVWSAIWQPQIDQSCQITSFLYDSTGEVVAQAILNVPSQNNSLKVAGLILISSTQNFFNMPAIVILTMVGLAVGWVCLLLIKAFSSKNDKS